MWWKNRGHLQQVRKMGPEKLQAAQLDWLALTPSACTRTSRLQTEESLSLLLEMEEER